MHEFGQKKMTPEDHADKSGSRRMLNEKQVLGIVSVSRSTLLRMEKTGQFPKGGYASANRKLWFVDEIVDWQNAINGRGPPKPSRVKLEPIGACPIWARPLLFCRPKL